MRRRILITGVAGTTGSALARRLLADPGFETVIGLDSRLPAAPLPGLDLIEADVRDPAIGERIAATGADTVVHNQIVRRPSASMSPRAMHDINVLGSLQLITALERTPTVRVVVVRGSAGIYGAEPQAPQFFREELTGLFALRSRFQRDIAEIEEYFATYAQRRPGVVCTMLRFQPAIGPSVDTQVTRYLSLPVAPTYAGFDPRMQFLHEEDALGALEAAIANPVPGPVNVAAPGTIGLMRMLRLAGRPSLPVAGPLFSVVTGSLARVGMSELPPDFRRLLRYGRAVDVTRLIEEVGYRPRFDTVAAVRDHVARAGGSRLVPRVAR